MKQAVFLIYSFALALTVEAQEIPGRYIVELKGDPASVAGNTSGKRGSRAAIAERRITIQNDQKRLQAEIERGNVHVIDAVQTVANALVVEASETEAASLAQLPEVAGVYPVVLYQLRLDRAAVLQRVPEAWARIGGTANAGTGVKIGIIDTGIDASHRAFQDPALPPVEGFPKFNHESDIEHTNAKVIVARSYDRREAAGPARDKVGHGTGVAMVAAGNTVSGPYGSIAGIATKAYLGNYKVFPDNLTGAPNDLILKAIDDAVADGMDVINLSLGSLPALRTSQDVLVGAIERATAAGILVVVASGNEGPDANTIGSPGTAPSAITVGNAFTDRLFASQATVDGTVYVTLPGSSSASAPALQAQLFDISLLDPAALACEPLPAASLTGKVVLILRGTCTFEVKANNAQQAGAAGAIVYTHSESPAPITMEMGSASLPAAMLSFQDGLDLKRRIGADPNLQVRLNFRQAPLSVNPQRLGESSSRGPSVDSVLKPDLLAVGTSVYTAAPGGFAIASGTSLSAPMVTGALAVLKSARPGLRAEQYRSILVASASTFTVAQEIAPISEAGTGLLDVSAALRSTFIPSVTSLGFGTGSSTVDATRAFQLTNSAAATDTLSLSIHSAGPGLRPILSRSSLQLAPGAAANVSIRLEGRASPGVSQGFVVVRSSLSDSEIRLPYWYGVASEIPRYITLFNPPESGRPGARVNIRFRVTDAAGIPVTAPPSVTALEGGGSVNTVTSLDSIYPGVFQASVELGAEAGNNIFVLQHGERTVRVPIEGR